MMPKTLSAPKRTRNSGIELLKIFAILLIVLSHTIQTFGYRNPYISYSDHVIDYTVPTTDPAQLVVSILACLVVSGTAIFFVCSAWFLLESKKTDYRKCCFMVAEVWVISVLIALLAACNRSVPVTPKFFFYSLFPTTFATNWYVTCYLLFYLIHGKLNLIIRSMSRLQLLRTATVLCALYLVLNFLRGGLFFANDFIIWVVIYFLLAYLKFYAKDFCDNRKLNLILLVSAIALNVLITVVTNYLGLRIGFFSGRLLQTRTMSNPLLILIAITSLNLARTSTLQSGFINALSKLSLLIYLIHENIILSTYYRPMLVHWAYLTFGYDHLLLLIFALAGAIFTSSAAVSYLYTRTLQPLVRKLGDALYRACLVVWIRWAHWLIRS